MHGIDFEVNQGEYVGIIGQTGSGKTTLIEHLNALLMPTTGTVEW
ncbi:ABC transporter ATP-binding protein, partial [Mycoplasmopsis synoviae]